MSKTTALDDPARKVDPRNVGHQPPHKEQEKIAVPGENSQMNPKPDHGEDSYRGLGRLKDKVAFITGGDSGIGRAIAIAFAREGADVCIGYLNEEEDARETERWVKEAGRKALLLPGDIRDEEHCRRMIEQAFQQFGKIDMLINNAAFQMTHDSIEEFSTEEFDRTFKTNVYAMFWLCKFAIPRMEPGSVIINTASIQSFDPSPESARLRVHERRDRELYERLGKDGVEAGDSRKRCSARTGLDAAHPEHDARRKGRKLRFGHAVRAGGAASGAGAALCVFGL